MPRPPRCWPVVLVVALACQSSRRAPPPPAPDSVSPTTSSMSLQDSNTTDETMVDNKLVIYQVFTRLFGNVNTTRKFYGTREENGVGKFNDITDVALREIKALGVTHVWYTGVIEHALLTSYAADGIAPDDPDVVKGRAGSPYAIKDYYDVNPDLAVDVRRRMAEYQALLARTHAQGLKVIMDFVPNHVARQYRSDARPPGTADLGERDDRTKVFDPQNNFYYLPGQRFRVPRGNNPLAAEKAPGEDGAFEEFPARATGNDVFVAEPSVDDWFETIKLNYGVDIQHGRTPHFDPIPNTWHKMRDILEFWADKGVDGFRCDMAEMVPVAFWGWVIPQVQRLNPNVTFIAEVYNPAQYRTYLDTGRFDFLYDKVGLYDTLRRVIEGKGHTGGITYCWQHETRGIGSHMLRFLENHDEQRLASRQFADDPWVALPAMTVSATLSSGPVMVYFGQEVGEKGNGYEGFSNEDGRTSIFDYWGVPAHQQWMNDGRWDGGGLAPWQKDLRAFYARLLNFCTQSEAIRRGKFYCLHADNQHGKSQGYQDALTYAYLRYTPSQRLLIVANFDRRNGHRTVIKIPRAAWVDMGLDPEGEYTFRDQLHPDAPTLHFAAAATQSLTRPAAGLPIFLPVNNAAVYEITP